MKSAASTPFKRILLVCFFLHCFLMVALWENANVTKVAKPPAKKQSITLGLRTAAKGTVATANITPQQAQKETIKPEPVKEPEPKTEPVKEPEPKPEPVKEPEPKTEPVKEPEVQKEFSTQPLQVAQVEGSQGIDGSEANELKQNESGNGKQTAGAPNSSVYDAALRKHLMGFKRYPRSLKLKRKEGNVEVLFSINRKGELLSRKVIKRTGDKAFDKAIYRLFERAKPFPVPPEPVSWDKKEYRLSFNYEIN